MWYFKYPHLFGLPSCQVEILHFCFSFVHFCLQICPLQTGTFVSCTRYLLAFLLQIFLFLFSGWWHWCKTCIQSRCLIKHSGQLGKPKRWGYLKYHTYWWVNKSSSKWAQKVCCRTEFKGRVRVQKITNTTQEGPSAWRAAEKTNLHVTQISIIWSGIRVSIRHYMTS